MGTVSTQQNMAKLLLLPICVLAAQAELVLRDWPALNKNFVLDASQPSSRETIMWTKGLFTRHRPVFATCSEDYILADYHENGDKYKEVIKVFVAKKAGSPPKKLSTAGHSGGKGSKLHFGNVFFSDSVKGSAIFFVLHPNKWGPYQHRFKTSSFTK